MAEFEGETTTLSLAKTKSDSLRTTVPKSLVHRFGLKPGDKLGWRTEAHNDKLIIVVAPIKHSSGKASHPNVE